jgi:peptidyl-prolyl cis-trans isomerase B (cyclophilin B)
MVSRVTCWGLAGLVFGVAPVGCGGKPTDKPAPTVSVPTPGGEAPDSSASAPAPMAASFADAVTENSPDDQLPPPDRTLNGLSTGKVRVEVQRLWDDIPFATAAGKKLAYTATLDTELGPVAIALLPEIAPNHVRNFVALARAGYYDGLLFESVIQQQGDGPDARLDLVEGGCPAGTGEPGIGHLGYWLKPEFNAAVKHEEGTVGACLSGAEDTAACRFYISLSKAPLMDGNFTAFGKVTAGLDVVRTIGKQPRPDGSTRPHTPAAIRTVTIQTREVE